MRSIFPRSLLCWKRLFLLVFLSLISMAEQSPDAKTPKALEDVAGDQRWMSQHKRFLTETHDQEPEVLFLGDSLIQRLQDTDIWKELFQPLHCLNFGIGGDTTQNLLWRIMDGSLDIIRPKVVVILIGTNNIFNSAAEVTEGIIEIVRIVRDKQPQSQILLLELFPRGERPNIQREKNNQVNKLLRDYFHSIPKTSVINLDPGFVTEDNMINAQDMPDYLHFSNKAYKKAFAPLRDIIVGYLDPAELPTQKELSDSTCRSGKIHPAGCSS